MIIVSGCRVLICRGRNERPDLERAVLAAGGAPASAVVVERRPHPDLGLPLPAHDAILFAAPGEAAAYVHAYGPAVLEGEVWCTDEAAQAAVDRLRDPAARRPAYALDTVERRA